MPSAAVRIKQSRHTGVFFIMEKTYTLKKFASGMHYVVLDETIVKKFVTKENYRVICTANGVVEFHGAILPKKEEGHFINIGSAICRKLKIKEGSRVKLSFQKDTTSYQFEMPDEFAQVLKTDLQANKVFEHLTDGNKRGLIYLITQVKSVDKRIERSLKIAERLKAGITSPRVILK